MNEWEVRQELEEESGEEGCFCNGGDLSWESGERGQPEGAQEEKWLPGAVVAGR